MQLFHVKYLIKTKRLITQIASYLYFFVSKRGILLDYPRQMYPYCRSLGFSLDPPCSHVHAQFVHRSRLYCALSYRSATLLFFITSVQNLSSWSRVYAHQDMCTVKRPWCRRTLMTVQRWFAGKMFTWGMRTQCAQCAQCADSQQGAGSLPPIFLVSSHHVGGRAWHHLTRG